MRRIYQTIRSRCAVRWRMFWLRRAGRRGYGRLAAWLASRHAAPYHQQAYLADLVPDGFMASSAHVAHRALRRGRNVYLGDRVVVVQAQDGGPVELGDRVQLYGNSLIQTGQGGTIVIGADTHIQPGCYLQAYLHSIRIGRQVEVAPGCAFYSYDHGTVFGVPIMLQPLQSKGDIVVGDGAWLGHGVIVLQGVSIGAGAVIAAGSVVVHDVPANAIAAGVPARVIRYRVAAEEGSHHDRQHQPVASTLRVHHAI